MVRIKRGVTAMARHKKVIKQTKGFRGQSRNVFKRAKEALMRARLHQYKHRRLIKRTMRALWIIRINAACKLNGISYSRFTDGLNKANVEVDRKILSDLAARKPEVFARVVEEVKSK